MQLRVALVIVGVLGMMLVPATVAPAYAQGPQDQQPPDEPYGGINLDLSGLMDTAADLFNSMWSAFAVVAGLTLAYLIIKFLMGAIKGALSS